MISEKYYWGVKRGCVLTVGKIFVILASDMTMDELEKVFRDYADGDDVQRDMQRTHYYIIATVRGVTIRVYTRIVGDITESATCFVGVRDKRDYQADLRYRYFRWRILGDESDWGVLTEAGQDKLLSDPNGVLSELCGTDMRTILGYLEGLSSVPYEEIRTDPLRYAEDDGGKRNTGDRIAIEYARSLI